jgi:Tol biopolymer transport system component
MTTQQRKLRGKMRKCGMLLSLALGTALAAIVVTAGTAQQAEAAFTEKTVFTSNRATGTGVDNPTGDYEIFSMNPDGTGVKQLTFNSVNDFEPTLSPDATKVAYQSEGIQFSNQEGDAEIYVMNAGDGSSKKNLSNNGSGVDDYSPVFSPDGKKIAYQSQLDQASNSEGDWEVYRVNTLDGSGKKNLSNNGPEVDDTSATFSPDGTKIAYASRGVQASNSGGDQEIYRMNTLDGSGKKNLTSDDANDSHPDYSPDGQKIAYQSWGVQTSNPEGDVDIYRMNTLDGSGKKNLSNNGPEVDDTSATFSPDGTKVMYESHGAQTSNLEGDPEIYRMNTLDGKGKKNLSNSGSDVSDIIADYSSDGTKVTYVSSGVQSSNTEGDFEVYRMNFLDGSGQTNLTNDPATDGAFLISRR